jgi:hypothetical protein
MTMQIIKTATESDEVPVIDVLVLAFSMDPGARWTWPERRQYLTHKYAKVMRTLHIATNRRLARCKLAA